MAGVKHLNRDRSDGADWRLINTGAGGDFNAKRSFGAGENFSTGESFGAGKTFDGGIIDPLESFDAGAGEIFGVAFHSKDMLFGQRFP